VAYVRFFFQRMNSTALATIAATGFTVAFFHAAIPTHWLPFVLVARARQWSRSKAVSVAIFAGLGHVALTSLLGLAIAWFGFELDEHLGNAFTQLAGGVLLAVGCFYFFRQWRGKGILHHHTPGGHHEPSSHCGHEQANHSHLESELEGSVLVSDRKGDWAAISGLLVMLTLSPCEGFLPIYLSGVKFGWQGFFVLSGILAVGTLGGMLLFTWLTLIGFEKVELKRIERWEAGLLGVVFTVLGVLVLTLEHAD
jgi:ABC-type nickel/cobalt efflux system permease component RcnA